MPASLPARVSDPPGCHHIGVFVPHFDINIPDAAQAVMCPAINVVFLSWVHFLMHGGIVGTLLPFIGGSLPALLVANWKVCACHTAIFWMSGLCKDGAFSKCSPRTLQVNCWALTGCPLLQVWPIANTIAFRYIPQDLRIIYQNVLGVAMVNACLLSAMYSRLQTALLPLGWSCIVVNAHL